VLLETINNCYRAPLQIYPTFVSDGAWNGTFLVLDGQEVPLTSTDLNGGSRGHRLRLNAAGKGCEGWWGGGEEEEEEKEEDKGMVRQNIEVAF
jgi:hypothetical protein